MSVQKIGYSYGFRLSGFTWDGEMADFHLGVDVLFDTHEPTDDSWGGVASYVEVVMDVENECIQLVMQDNPYFDRVKIHQYEFIKIAPLIAPPAIGVERGNEIVKVYCQQVKSGVIHRESVCTSGEQLAYWHTDTY